MNSNRKLYAAKVVGVAAVYYGAAKLGLSLAFATPSVTAVWAPTGIALAAVVLWGYRLWPGVALGAFLANAWTGVPIYTVLGITVGNTLEALVAAYLLTRVADFRPSLERVRDVLALVLLGGIVSTTVAATIGVTSLLVGDEIAAGDFGSVWRTWWLGDMGGDLLVAPAIMVAVTHWPYRRAPGRLLEAAALGLLVLGLTALIFAQTDAALFPYQLFPLLVWAALRFWQPGAVVASLLVASLAIPLTEDDLGPFAGSSPDDRLLLAQAFLGILSLTGLVLAAVITERQRFEDSVEYIADTLQESLLAPHLPELAGIETAVDFKPAGEQHIVGGDFYDLLESDDGSFAVVVGDAVGKGADAAATAALARYTLRAASLEEHRPSRVLEVLNRAILRQAPGQTCTVAYARLELRGTGGARMTVAIGGHPLPLVLRSDGIVESIGRPAPPLGMGPRPAVVETAADLAPGDALVLYTDGVTDAYAPDRFLSPTELADVLRSAAGRGAAEIAEIVRGAALDGGEAEPRDDILLFVIRVPDAAARGAASQPVS